MPLGATSYENAALDAIVLTWPASGATYRLYSSNPMTAAAPGDVELGSAGGYAPVTFVRTAWDAAASSQKSKTAPVSYTTTAAWSDVAKWWAVVDTSGVVVFYNRLDKSITVEDAATVANFTPTLSFSDAA